ncbi:hypothetical protein BDV40DRAFT_41025 [Aspergillus tamarii]|uniref:Uncharacterized protein n=1 Tax=Aspergillus tamarii TaxID=41984 RepID=A0A5N6V4W6_ASPTM|nr:hypothetical protein BDV40DRAFT_41025 [Aspergillus tamarii]
MGTPQSNADLNIQVTSATHVATVNPTMEVSLPGTCPFPPSYNGWFFGIRCILSPSDMYPLQARRTILALYQYAPSIMRNSSTVGGDGMYLSLA